MKSLGDKSKRHPLWRKVPKKQWDDWRWQSQNAIRSVRQLRELLPFSQEELEAMGDLEARVQDGDSALLLLLVNCDDPSDPIRLQSVTSPLEANSTFGSTRSEEDKDSPCPASPIATPIALMVTTHLHHVLPLLHPQARHHGPRRLGRHQPR
ncbi:MAG: hypothetical protein U0793_22180 [Gemmataceae bacterium]